MFNGRLTTILVTVCATIALSACGKDEKKQADDLKKEGDQKIAAVVKDTQDLRATYNIKLDVMDASMAADAFDWTLLDIKARGLARKKLNTQVANVGRILEIAHHKNLAMDGTSQRNLHVIRTNAQKYLSALEAFEKRGSVNRPAAPATRPNGPGRLGRGEQRADVTGEGPTVDDVAAEIAE